MQPLPTVLLSSDAPQTIPLSDPLALLSSLPTDATPEHTGITQPPVIPVLPGVPTPGVPVLPSLGVPVLPGVPTPGVPVLPGVPTPGVPVQEPVHPVNSGNTAGVSSLEPEGNTGTPAEGNTEGVTPKTFKIPNPVFRSLEENVRLLNEGTPGYTVHGYGVEILSRHLEFRQTASKLIRLNGLYQESESHLTATRTLLHHERQRVADLTAQLAAARDYVNRQEHHPTPNQVLPPVLLQPSAVIPCTTIPGMDIPELKQKYNTLLGRYEKSLDGFKSTEAEYAQVKAFISLLPQIVNRFAKEAAANSWYTPAYYVTFFRHLVSTHSK